MEGDADSVLEATDAACADALASLAAQPPLGVIAFDCIARRGVLGEHRIEDEIERAAEALEVETAALVAAGQVVASVGFPQGKVPEDALVAAVEAGAGTASLSLGVLGPATAAVASVDEAEQSWLVVAGLESAALAADEVILLRAMARVLSLHLRTLRAFE